MSTIAPTPCPKHSHQGFLSEGLLRIYVPGLNSPSLGTPRDNPKFWEFFSKNDKLIKTPHFASKPDRYYIKMKTVRIKYIISNIS